VKPEVTVFMAVYNGEKYLKQAIESVLQQTYQDFELMIVDDGSTDSSLSIINAFTDKRIKLLQNDVNKGLAFTRNRGIEEARGKFFATLDCDDLAYKNRLEKQLKFFYSNKDVAICGGKIKYINQHSNYTGKLFSLRGDEDFLKAILLFNNIYFNSATMISTEILRKFRYRESFAPAEDFDLFEQIAEHYKIGFINEWLCDYRVHEGNISTLKSKNRWAAENVITERQLVRYGFNFSSEQLNLHTKFTNTNFDFIGNHLQECKIWFNCLIEQNQSKKIFNQYSFRLALARQWIRICFYQFERNHTITPVFKKGKLKYAELVYAFVKSL
jgi:glycosyltransferase involved in cell wall biosynthesis